MFAQHTVILTVIVAILGLLVVLTWQGAGWTAACNIRLPMAGLARVAMLLGCLVLAGCGGANVAVPTAAPTVQPTSRPVIAVAAPSRAVPSPSAGSTALASGRTPETVSPLVYVAIGASDTVGVGATNPAREGWVPRLAQLLGPATVVSNLGVSGTLIHAALQDQLPAAVRDKPSLVTVWLAVNDFDARVPLPTYSADLDSLLGALEQTHASVLVANVPNLLLVPTYHAVDPQVLGPEVDRWNAAIADAVRRHHARLVDLYAAWAELAGHPEFISSDGFHPSSAGYARVADLFYTQSQL